MDKTSSRYCIVLIYLVLILSGFIAYEPMRHNDFVGFDDDKYVTQNPLVKMGLARESVKWAFTSTYLSNWHPLTWLSHMLDCQFFGPEPFWHHLTNLLFHIANTVLLFWLLKKMTGRIWPSAFVAAAFALHPLHVESVAWVSERKDILSGLFWMLTIAAYIQYTKHHNIGWYLLVFLAFGLGLMAKPMIVTLPFVLLLLDYWPMQRFQLRSQSELGGTGISILKTSRLIIEKIPLFVLMLISSVITFVVQRRAMEMDTGVDISLITRISNAIVSYLAYILKIFYPTRLAVLYPHLGSSLPLWQIIVSFLILATISAGVIYNARKRRYLLVGWLWYLGTLLPVIGLVQFGVQAMADRYTYLPSIGIFIMIAWGASEILTRWRYQRIGLAITAAIVLTGMLLCTRMQLRHWRNSFTLFEHTLKVTKNNFTMHYNYGYMLSTQGRFADAVMHFDKALQINPQYHDAYNNKGLALLELGEIDKAIECFNEVLKLKPDFHRAHNNLGMAFYRMGKTDLAIEQWLESVRLSPDDDTSHFNLGMEFIKQDKIDKAIEHFNRVVEIRPYWPEAHYKLGIAYYRQGRLDLAAKQCARALSLKPDYTEANISLAHNLFELGRIQQAIDYYYRLLRLQPNQVEVLNNLTWILATIEDEKFQNPAEAVKFAQRACQLTGYQQPQILDTLAVAYAAAGNFPEAIKAAEKALKLAESSGEKDFAQQIRSRMELYKTGQPYREPSPKPIPTESDFHLLP
ncbi:MAG: tetratricopeptide repeat protein [Planctomycetota bacterium]|jgi:tetratricopeptide (TPR) repeat protein